MKRARSRQYFITSRPIFAVTAQSVAVIDPAKAERRAYASKGWSIASIFVGIILIATLIGLKLVRNLKHCFYIKIIIMLKYYHTDDNLAKHNMYLIVEAGYTNNYCERVCSAIV